MRALLITDCLQRDFVGPIDRFEGLPNALHVGYDESLRLLGPEPEEGPVARMMRWAHSQPDDVLGVVHVRDWHDAADASQNEHLAQFGAHCLAGSRGADFVFRLDDIRPGKNVGIVDSTTLTNFHRDGLDRWLAPHAGEPLRVGLMGAWTEAKITFLAYELRARYPQFQMAVCSALTASSSRRNHFLALDQLERLLGVQVIDSVGAFIEYLGGAWEDTPLIGFNERHPSLDVDPGTTLAETDRRLVRYLFRGCRSVQVRSLDGGFSGNAVLAARSVDFHGHAEAPHVIKIGEAAAIGQERTAFERIESVLGNSAPRIVDFADLQGRGALKYRYAAIGRSPARPLQKLYQAGMAAGETGRVLDAVFVDQLGRLYAAAEPERCDLLEYYGFDAKWAPSIANKLVDLLGPTGMEDELLFPGDVRVPSVLGFYTRELARLPRMPRSHYFAHVHGDLNGANILLDEPGNVWLIDFFHSHRGHVLRDLAKLENDLLYIWTPLDADDHLVEAMAFTDWMLEVRDLGRPLVARTAPKFSHEPLRRAAETVEKLRSYYPLLVQADRDPSQLLIAQIRYAVHTLGFDEASLRQKHWALYTASRAAQQLARSLHQTGPLRVDWLPPSLVPTGRVGLTIVPGRRDYGRSLDADLRALQRAGVQDIVCLLAPHEFEHYGVPHLITAYRDAGFEVLQLPTLDRTPPSPTALDEGTAWIEERIGNGRSVLIHCVGGLGRAGTLAASWLARRGLSAADAIASIRASRSPRAIETPEQELAVHAICAPD